MSVIALGRLLRQDVIPLVVVYALFLVMLVATWRRSPPKRPAPPSPGLLGHVLRTATAGYVVLLAILAVFYVGLGGRSWAFFGRAAWKSAVLAYVVVVPGFLGLSWVEARLRRRRSRSLGTGS